MHKTGTRAFPNHFKIPDASCPQHVCVTGYLSGESKEKKKSAQGDEEENEEEEGAVHVLGSKFEH